ncbi:MAG: I78 family peptidase inhibitor [Pseudomonadota bacterium]
MRIGAFALIGTLLLAACQEDEDDSAAPIIEPDLPAEAMPGEVIDTGDACGADGWQFLIGQNRDILAVTPIPTPMRALGPTDVATTDFIPERLNIFWDEDEVITRVECG